MTEPELRSFPLPGRKSGQAITQAMQALGYWPMPDPELIRAAIAASGLSARRFAERVMARDERTIRRWVAGATEIPPVARRWLEDWLGLSAAARLRVVKALD